MNTKQLRDEALKALLKTHLTDYALQARLWDCVFANSTIAQVTVIRETLIRVTDRYLNQNLNQ